MHFIFDGNAVLNVTTPVAIYSMRNNSNMDMPYVQTGGEYILKESSKQYYRNFVLKYIQNILWPLNRRVDRVIFAFDSSSWRKYLVEKHFGRTKSDAPFVYKGKRKRDESFNAMLPFFDYFIDELMPEIMEIPGVCGVRTKGAEGDDIIAVLCNDIADDIAIWTVDSDINQLVCRDSRYIVVLGSKQKDTGMKRLFSINEAGTGVLVQSKPMSFDINFDAAVSSNGYANLIHYLVTEKDYENVQVNPYEYIFKKILHGDDSDNIMSVYTKIIGEKRFRLKAKVIDDVWSDLVQTYAPKAIIGLIDARDQEFLDKVAYLIVRHAKLDQDKQAEITENLKLNTRLIRLSIPMIPEEMVGMIRYKYQRALELNQARFDFGKFNDYIKKYETK